MIFLLSFFPPVSSFSMLLCGLLKLKVSCDLILFLPVLTLGFTVAIRIAWMPKIHVWVLSGWVGLAGVLSQEPFLACNPRRRLD